MCLEHPPLIPGQRLPGIKLPDTFRRLPGAGFLSIFCRQCPSRRRASIPRLSYLGQQRPQRQAARSLPALLPLLECPFRDGEALRGFPLREAMASPPFFQAAGYVQRSRHRFRHNP